MRIAIARNGYFYVVKGKRVEFPTGMFDATSYAAAIVAGLFLLLVQFLLNPPLAKLAVGLVAMVAFGYGTIGIWQLQKAIKADN